MKTPNDIRAAKQLRVVVDAGVGRESALMREASNWLGRRAGEILWLDDAHHGIPDVEILDKVLGKKTVLVTRDRVLHNQARKAGFLSLTLDRQGRLTHHPLPGIRLPKQEPASRAEELRADYVREPSAIALALKQGLTEKRLKKCRRRRRRIRNHFGSADSIAKSSVTLSSRTGRKGPLFGYMLNVAGNSGVKGLKASEGYCRPADGRADPAFCIMHALADIYLLELDRAPVELFVIPSDALRLLRQLSATSDQRDLPASTRALCILLDGLSEFSVHPCTKGRFHDMAENKLTQLTRSKTNEIVAMDFAAMIRSVLSIEEGAVDGSHSTPLEFG